MDASPWDPHKGTQRLPGLNSWSSYQECCIQEVCPSTMVKNHPLKEPIQYNFSSWSKEVIELQDFNIHHGIHFHVYWQVKAKIIASKLIQDGERTISNSSQFLVFSLYFILANMEPYLVSDLELVIKLVFFMSSLVLILTFLQVFLYYLMNHLDSLKEISCFFLVTLFVGILILPKDHV